jgi:RHS repeat-associated protein
VSQTVDDVTTSYVLDSAAPLTLVLAETTGTETIYNLHGLDLVAQNDGASTEYFAYDGLGSVRQVLDSSGGVLYAQVFDPYGNPYASAGTGSTSFGFTGEQTDGNGLIFLRARYYDPRQGRFLQRDTWRGNDRNQISLNPWLYVYNNPVNLVDPTGMVPTENEIREGRHVYSCNCGWIDFAHAHPDNSKDIFKLLNAEPSPILGISVREDVLLVTMRINFPLTIQVTLNSVVRTGLSEQIKREVALGMFMAREEHREWIQAISPWSRTSFSEEDLTSDLIGFYMGVNGLKNARKDNASWEWLSNVCDFPKDRERAKKWSLAVLKERYKFKKVRKWGAPRLVCSSSINQECDSIREWPAEFKSINPEEASVEGNWWFYRGWQKDGHFLTTNIPDVYYLWGGDL